MNAQLDDRLDRTRRRQTARFLDHLESEGRGGPEIARDVKRMMKFTFQDVKYEIENAGNNHNGYKK